MRGDVLVATWGGGGNLPPLLSVAGLLAARGHRIRVLASGATRPAAEQAGFEVVGYRRSPDPRTDVTFESQTDRVLATIAGPEIAADVRGVLTETDPDLFVADCMLPAALAAARTTAVPTVSVVHFLYGLARTQMIKTGTGWTTDVPQLNATRGTLGLGPVAHPLEAWEDVDLVLVTAPRWFDVDANFPAHVIHAGPLGVRRTSTPATGRPPGEPRVLISFSTTLMDGQSRLVQAACDAVADADVSALLTLGPAASVRSARLPTNVTVVPYADHDEVLPGCSAVVAHGGLGTTLRSLAHGVPQLMLPLGRDQHVNADRVARLGAGIVLAADSPPARIRAALERLLGDDRFRAAATRTAARIAASDPDRTAASALDELVRDRRR